MFWQACPQPFLHARSKSADHLQLRRPFAVRCPFHLSAAICTRPQQMPVLGVCASPGCSSRTGCVCVCVCASPGFRPWTGCVCVCASPGCVRQSWLFFQDWVCVPGGSSRTGCVCVCQSWLPSIGCVCQSDHLQLWHPFAAVHCPFCLSAAICACPQTICSSGALFMLAAFYSLFMVAQPFNSQGFDNHFCSLIASIFRCNPDSRHV